jgi:hypothetical protein
MEDIALEYRYNFLLKTFCKLCVTAFIEQCATTSQNSVYLDLSIWFFCLKTMWIMVMFFHVHSWVDVPWTLPFSISIMHALLPKNKIKYKSMSMLGKKHCESWAYWVSYMTVFLIPCLLGMVKSRYPTNTGLLPSHHTQWVRYCMLLIWFFAMYCCWRPCWL